MANRKGRLIHAGDDVYEGDWHEDTQNGFGIETWTDGARSEGQYHMNQKHGIGKYYWADGSKYEGEFHHSNNP
jgi:hypothetical protein